MGLFGHIWSGNSDCSSSKGNVRLIVVVLQRYRFGACGVVRSYGLEGDGMRLFLVGVCLLAAIVLPVFIVVVCMVGGRSRRRDGVAFR